MPAENMSIRIIKADSNVPTPCFAKPGDVGLDLIANSIEKMYDNVVMVNTGVKIQPPEGYHFKLYARSSLHRAGFSLGNGVGVIDKNYTGPILAPLLKIKDECDVQGILGQRIVQLVLEKSYTDFPIVEVSEFEQTERGSGGFGSTGK